MKLKLFSKLFDETWAYGRCWTNLQFVASSPQCKLETDSPGALWMKMEIYPQTGPKNNYSPKVYHYCRISLPFLPLVPIEMGKRALY